MEEEGEEDDIKEGQPTLKIKATQINSGKHSTSLSSGNIPTSKKPSVSQRLFDSDEDNADSSSSESLRESNHEDKNVSQINTSKIIAKDNEETSEEESTDEEKNCNKEMDVEECTKTGKIVSFSPSTEFLDDTEKSSEAVEESEEEVSTLSFPSTDKNENLSENDPTKGLTEEADSDKKTEKSSEVMTKDIKLNDVKSHTENENELNNLTEEDKDTNMINESKETLHESKEDVPLQPSKALDNCEKSPCDEPSSDPQGISLDKSVDEVPSGSNLDEAKEKLNKTSEHTIDKNSENICSVDSPTLPPRNSNITAPSTSPKPDVSAKKGIGTPLISAMKKFVEVPKTFIKNKLDSKSPTRKNKDIDSKKQTFKDTASKSSDDKEKNITSKSPNSKDNELASKSSTVKDRDNKNVALSCPTTNNGITLVDTKSKDDTGSPPLPPRNKPDTVSSSHLSNDNIFTGSPFLPLKSSSTNVAKDSPKLPPRNRMETAFISSPKTDQTTDNEVANIPSKNYTSDDPKRFSSLQPKKNNGNSRVRESSLPPPNRPQDQDGRKSPKIPPQTWMWEEIKRSKIKGGYPWTHLYKGSFDEAKWREIMEHEYEYVDPRPELLRPEPVRPQVSVRLTPSPEPEKPKQQRRFIRIPDTDQVIIPLHGSSDEEHNPDRYDDPSLIGQEEIGLTPPAFRPTPSPSPSRRKVEPEPKLSDKLRTTAGHLGSKIRKISIPDKSKIRLPEKPKFLSEISNIKLPEKPKFLTEKPKFLTEKPKFLTEKPKFLTEKPKFLTEKPKFLTEKPKFLTERPKFLKEGIKLPDTSKFKLPERPKISMPTIKLPKRRSRTKRETSVKSEFGSDKNIFHTIKARTYPRFLNKKKKLGIKKATPPPNQTRFESESLPSTPRSKRNDKWTDVYKDKHLGEEKVAASYTNGESFHERYSKREAKRASSSSIVDSDREQASSGSSTQRHRAGVIEEIDSDEFFVRVKGISREDVQVSRYLSSEIRDAFRSPKNALASLDKEDFDDEEPLPPHRSKKPKEYPRKEFNTFPMRPSRAKKGAMEKPPRRFRSKVKPSSLSSLNRETEFDMEVESVVVTKTPPMPPQRRKSAKDIHAEDNWTATSEFKMVPDEGMALDEMKAEYDIPPVAPVRKTRSRGTSLADEDRTSRGAESIKSEMQIEDELNDDLHMEDDSRDKEVKEIVEMKQNFALQEVNIPLERSMTQESPAYSNVDKSKPPRPPPPQNETPKGKTLSHHKLKSKILGNRHVQQLQSWKNQGVNFFFTYPRRAMKTINKTPKRPVRNYSTIAGPTRPPRRHKVFREPVYVDADVEPEDSIPFIDEDEKLKSSRSEDVIGGMKGRPLPPPPMRSPSPSKETASLVQEEPPTIEEINILNDLTSRISADTADKSSTKMDDVSDKMQGRPLPPPPRRKRGSSSSDRKRGSFSEDANTLNDLDRKEAIDAKMTIDILEHESIVTVQKVEPVKIENEEPVAQLEPPVRPTRQETSSRKVMAETSQQTSLEVAEITVSVQTDPLPEGVIVEETEDISSTSKRPESDEEPTIEKYLEKYGSEIKMLGRQVLPPKSDSQLEEKKALPSKAIPDSKMDSDIVKNIEREIIPSNFISTESEKNLNKSETKIIEKTFKVEKETPKKEEKVSEENVETRPKEIPITLPDRLHLSHLDVDNLNVSSLKASQILVSDLSGQSIQVAELTSRGGNLVVSGMEFPPSFIQSLASEISAKVEEKIPQKPVDIPSKVEKPVETSTEIQPSPARSESPHRPQRLTVVTAPPAVVVQPSTESIKPPSPEVGKILSSDSIPTPRTTRNKGKKSVESSRIVDDSEDELATAIKASSRPSSSRSSPVRQVVPSSSQPPQQLASASGLTARQLLVELLKIWENCLVEGFSACSNTIGSMFPDGQKRRDAQTAACVLFVIIIGLFALGFGTDNTVHYHHWDFVPPRV